MAAVAGTLVVLYYGVINFFIGFLAGIKAFTAAVLGRLGFDKKGDVTAPNYVFYEWKDGKYDYYVAPGA